MPALVPWAVPAASLASVAEGKRGRIFPLDVLCYMSKKVMMLYLFHKCFFFFLLDIYKGHVSSQPEVSVLTRGLF